MITLSSKVQDYNNTLVHNKDFRYNTMMSYADLNVNCVWQPWNLTWPVISFLSYHASVLRTKESFRKCNFGH